MRTERWGRGTRQFLGLHGWNGTRETFAPLLGPIPEDVTFRSVDLPGCGESAAPLRWDVNCVAGEIAREIDGPTTVVGNCSGAILALLVAQRAPALVERVVMIDAFAWWPWYFRVFLEPHIGRYAYFTAFANPVGRWLTNASLRGKRAAGTDLTQGFARADHESTYRYLTLLRDAGKAENFRDLSMPIDVLYGAKSFAAVRQSAYTWAGMWPQARTFVLENAGHLPILEAAQQVKEILFGGDKCSTQQPDHLLNSAR
jgi:pimeloyl-ACP methyl ester carboxylesterase